MTVAETLLVFAGAPLLVTAILAAFTLRPDASSRRRRYRPGQPWEHEPVWYAPHPEHAVAAAGHGADTAAQPGGRSLALGSSVYGEVQGGPAAGGPHLSTADGTANRPALGSGAGAGATAATAGAPPRGRGGPLGGARGTW